MNGLTRKRFFAQVWLVTNARPGAGEPVAPDAVTPVGCQEIIESAPARAAVSGQQAQNSPTCNKPRSGTILNLCFDVANTALVPDTMLSCAPFAHLLFRLTARP